MFSKVGLLIFFNDVCLNIDSAMVDYLPTEFLFFTMVGFCDTAYAFVYVLVEKLDDCNEIQLSSNC
jgi:hypothetical protein